MVKYRPQLNMVPITQLDKNGCKVRKCVCLGETIVLRQRGVAVAVVSHQLFVFQSVVFEPRNGNII